MPVLIDNERCDSTPGCFAARVCPKGALVYDEAEKKMVVDASQCGDCPAPCLNFCDKYALKYAPTLEDLELLQAEIDGTISAEELAQRRLEREQKAKEQELAAFDPIDLTAENFEQEALRAETMVVVHCGSSRSAASQQLLPVLQSLAREYAGKVKFANVDADKQFQVTRALGVTSLPTVFFFFHGQLVDGVVGPVSASDLQGRIYTLLLSLQGPGEPEERPDLLV
jgi:thiol-disulfide isomerase/thioredoxin